MSFKAKIIIFLRYGAGILIGFIIQYFILQEILNLKKKNIKILFLIPFIFFNILLLIIPLDFIIGSTLDTSLYSFAISSSIVYQVVSGMFFFVFKFCIFWKKHTKNFIKKTDKQQLKENINIERKAFLISGITSSMMLYTSILSVKNALDNPSIKNIEIFTKNLPIDKLKIVHLTDMHTGYFFDKSKVKHLKNTVLKLKPDLIVFTGDQLHNTHKPFLKDLAEGLKGIKAKYGIWQVAGNHDHRLGTKYLYDELSKIGIKYLDNDSNIITLPQGEIEIMGVDDLMYGGNFSLIKRKNPNIFSILLSHRPNILDETYNKNINLILSGHTHGGQIAFGKLSFSLFETSYTKGLYKRNNTYLYVSPGLGVTGIPMRLGAAAEISIITLRKS